MKPLTFEEQCQIGLEKRQKCQKKDCYYRKTISFDKCAECDRYTEQTPAPRPKVVQGKRTDIITELPHWLQTYQEATGARIVEHPKAWELTLPRSLPTDSVQMKQEILEKRIQKPVPPVPQEAPTPTKPKKWIEPTKYYEELTEEEREALNQQYEVFLI